MDVRPRRRLQHIDSAPSFIAGGSRRSFRTANHLPGGLHHRLNSADYARPDSRHQRREPRGRRTAITISSINKACRPCQGLCGVSGVSPCRSLWRPAQILAGRTAHLARCVVCVLNLLRDAAAIGDFVTAGPCPLANRAQIGSRTTAHGLAAA